MTPPSYDIVTMARAGRARPCLWAAVAVALVPAVLSAQSGEGPLRAGTPAATPTERTETGSPKADDEEKEPLFGLVKPEDGSFIPLPPGTTYADVLEWLAARRGPGYGINSVRITGQAGGDRHVELTAEVTVVVRHEEAVSVPLGFTEAVLVGVEHDGAGDLSYQPFSEMTGHAWFLQGRGEHRLRLTLLVPVSTRADETRLALTTPADAATTRVTFGVPAGAEVTAAGGIVRSTTETEAGTTVEWVGAGGRVELAWRPKPVAADPADLTATTAIFPSLSGKNVQLRAVQRVTAAKGRISAVRARLPDGFSVLDVTGRLVRSYAEEKADDGRVVVVQLVEPTEGTVDLTTKASAPLPANGKIAVNGFSLIDVPAEAQSGQIVIEPSTAYEIDVLDRSAGVERMEMVDPGQLKDSRIYEFGSQPFRVDLEIKTVPPSFSVSPELIFQVAPDRLDLDAEFAVEVKKGEVRELRLAWPASGWTVAPIRSGLIQETRRGETSGPPIDVSVLNAVQSFVVPMRANLRREAVSGVIEVPLPRLEPTAQSASAEQRQTLIGIRHVNNLEVDLQTVDVGPVGDLRSLADPGRAAGLPEPAPGERLTVFVVPPDVRQVRLRVRQLSREIAASSVVAVRPRGDGLHVEQRIDYEVRYDTVSELRLSVPKALRSRGIEFVDAGGQRLAAEAVGDPSGDLVEVRLRLDRSVKGPISISTAYDLKRPADIGAADVPIPLVRPADAELDSVELRASRLPRHLVAVAGPEWVPLQTTDNDGRQRWAAAEPGAAVPLRLLPRPEGETKTHAVSRMLLRSVVERGGGVRTVAECRLDRAPERVALLFPPGVEPEWVRWRGRPVRPVVVRDGEGRLAEVELGPGGGEPILAVGFRSAGGRPLGLVTASRLDAVRFGDEIAVEQTLWRVTLPESQHLFTGPAGYVARFRWGLHRGLWTRQTDEPFRQVGDWFGGDVMALGPEFDAGHQYAFSRAGAATPLGFTSLSRSLVVLIGAGAAIMAGYAFASGLLPRRRSVLIAFGAGLVVLWAFFPNQVQLFLQPAAFGLALVGAASLAEWALWKRQEKLAPQAPSAVEFVTILPGEGSNSGPPAAIGSEEPTVLRTGRPAEAVSSSHAPATPP